MLTQTINKKTNLAVKKHVGMLTAVAILLFFMTREHFKFGSTFRFVIIFHEDKRCNLLAGNLFMNVSSAGKRSLTAKVGGSFKLAA